MSTDWNPTPSASVEAALAALRAEDRFAGNIVRWERIAERAPRSAPFPAALDERLIAALSDLGLSSLYTHQVEAIAAALRGEHVVIATPAASGKTYCYNLPVLHRLLNPQGGRPGRALYLFPTKALAQDQHAGLAQLLERLPGSGISAGIYDGDTSVAQRPRIRDGARIILSNPDMLHMGILPQHPRWAAFFAALQIVVIDEIHIYRGIFGSHVANVLRRLRRICRFYGSHPQFIVASATIANPLELAERLVEAPVTIIDSDQDGSPQGEKHLLFYNPPIVDAELGIRKSHREEAASLAARFLNEAVQTIVFARSRMGAEMLLTQLRVERPAREARRIQGYRGGYLPAERRAIEAGLRSGTVQGVVATNALELGIDIGRLDAAILAGYPGTIAGARQQIGRAGRRAGPSVAVLVAGMGPLDQYIIAHPDWLLQRSPESARLNSDNPIVLGGHLACAAAELPLRAGEPFGKTPPPADLLEDLVAAGQLYRTADRYFWAGDGNPAAALGLRSAGPDRVMIQESSSGGKPRIIGEVDRASATRLVHAGAIYLHGGVSYQVESLDLEGGLARVREVEVDFYTTPSTHIEVEMLNALHGSAPAEGAPQAALEAARPYLAGWGDARVTQAPTGYKIIRRGTNEVLALGEVDLPPQIIETQACWLSFPEATIAALKAEGAWLSDPNDYGPNWPRQRRAARQRDGFRCQGCGAPEAPGKQHDVHHKAPFRAFVADPARREGLPAKDAWQVANRLPNLVTLCPTCHRRAEAGIRTRSGLSGAAALIEGVAPLFLMCDPGDLGILAEPEEATGSGHAPTITVYERTPGGVGYAEQLYKTLPLVLQAARDLVVACPCDRGCPACVGPVLDHEYTLDAKRLAAALLAAALQLGIPG